MNHQQDHREQNIGRLIQAAAGEKTRPDPIVRGQMFRRLQAEMRPTSAKPAEFPQWIIIALGAMLFLLAAPCCRQMTVPTSPSPGSAADVMLLVLILNLIWSPIAGAIIVLRRRYA